MFEDRSRLKRLVGNPVLGFRFLNRAYHTKFFTRRFNDSGSNVFEEDWDNLIIMDAARFDLFKNRVDVEKYGSFESKISRGSNSYEFILGNFFNQDLTDVAYLTTNDHILWMRDELDDELNLYDLKRFDRMPEGDEKGTFLPWNVREQAEELITGYQDKRIVIHFMQPHAPFLDEEDRFDFGGNYWYKVLSGEIEGTKEEFWDAYAETFDKAWEEVEKLIDELDGKTVVTSDHGNVFGEKVSPIPMKEWGHPQGIYDEKLVKVPWLVIEGDERREIMKGEPEESEDYDEEEIKDQLADLGYGE